MNIVALPLQLKILSSKNRFGKFWNFHPWWPQFWAEPKMAEMIFRELSNVAFCFYLWRPGAEIMGGRSNAPPPPSSRRWKKQRPSRARVNGLGMRDTSEVFGEKLEMNHRNRMMFEWNSPACHSLLSRETRTVGRSVSYPFGDSWANRWTVQQIAIAGEW